MTDQWHWPYHPDLVSESEANELYELAQACEMEGGKGFAKLAIVGGRVLKARQIASANPDLGLNPFPEWETNP